MRATGSIIRDWVCSIDAMWPDQDVHVQEAVLQCLSTLLSHRNFQGLCKLPCQNRTGIPSN